MPAKESKRSIFAAQTLPPWGHLSPEFVSGIDLNRRPADWLKSSGWNEARKEQHYRTWLADTLLRLRSILWPVYLPAHQVWLGASIPSMTPLTQIDLDLMDSLTDKLAETPVSPLAPFTLKTHLDLFQVEDQNGGADIFANYCYYDRTQTVAALEAIRHAAVVSLENKIGHTIITLKENLQRPRPMQMAIRFSHAKYKYHEAVTSLSPSMCCGHCLQANVAVAGAIEQLLAQAVPPPPNVLNSLGAWALDIGDRRVYAGVHYPSDNLCSCFVFLRMAPYLYSQAPARDTIGQAILNSAVFRAVGGIVSTKIGKHHRAIYDEICHLAALPFSPLAFDRLKAK